MASGPLRRRCTLRRRSSGRPEQRQRPAQREIDQRDEAEDQRRLEGDGVDQGPGAGELGEADERGDRRALDDLHHQPDRRRQHQAERLGHDDEPERRHEAETERPRHLPLPDRHRRKGAVEDLAEEGRRVEDEGEGGGRPRIGAEADEGGAVVDHEQLDEERRALDEAHIGHRQAPEDRRRADPHPGDDHAEEAAADAGDQREQDRPARGEDKEVGLVEGEVADHRLTPSSGTASARSTGTGR